MTAKEAIEMLSLVDPDAPVVTLYLGREYPAIVNAMPLDNKVVIL
jgi:hypothetical protein